MDSFRDFYLAWRAESNPWRECWHDLKHTSTLLHPLLPHLALFVGLNLFGFAFGRWRGGVLASRPTVLAGSVHALAASLLSTLALAGKNWDLWREVGLPLSISYFAADVIFYCVPRRDRLIAVHHLVIAFCHFPALTTAGAELAGCGDAAWSWRISAVGYTAEASTVLMNWRWYLLQTLEEDWWVFGAVNVLVVISWAARMVLYPYLLFVEILPRVGEYWARKQILFFIVMVAGHVIIGLLSLYWLTIMLRGGVRSLLTFRKKTKKNEGEGFSFGEDIGRGGHGGEKKGEERQEDRVTAADGDAGQKVPLLQRARDWVDGTFFIEQPESIKHHKKA